MTELSPNRQRAQRLLIGGLVGGHAVLIVAVVAFWVAQGRLAAFSAAIGGVLTIVFFTIGQAVQVMLAEASPKVVLVGALASFLARVVGLGLLLVLALEHAERLAWFAPVAFAISTIAVVVGWLAAEIWVFSRLRIPVFDEPRKGMDNPA